MLHDAFDKWRKQLFLSITQPSIESGSRHTGPPGTTVPFILIHAEGGGFFWCLMRRSLVAT